MSQYHTERSFCGAGASIETVININFFNRNRSFNSVLFVPHKTVFRMTCAKLQINTKIKSKDIFQNIHDALTVDIDISTTFPSFYFWNYAQHNGCSKLGDKHK